MTGTEKRLADGNLTREQKRLKWEAKQSRKAEATAVQQYRARWFQENAEFGKSVSEEDVNAIISGSIQNQHLLTILEPYFDIQDKTNKEAAFKSCQERLFIAEGTETIRLLIQQSTQPEGKNGVKPIKVKSIFCKTSAFF